MYDRTKMTNDNNSKKKAIGLGRGLNTYSYITYSYEPVEFHSG